MARSNPLALGRDLAIDLGTANTLIYARGAGCGAQRAVGGRDRHHRRPSIAVGIEAKRMMGRTPGRIKTIRPPEGRRHRRLRVCEKMLRFFIEGARQPVEQATHGHLRAIRHHRCRAAVQGAARARAPASARCTSSKNRWQPPSTPTCRCTNPAAT